MTTVIAVILVIVALVAVALMKKGGTTGTSEGTTPEKMPERFPYISKKVMTNPEQVLFFRIVDAVPDKVVLAQVQMSSFLTWKGKQTDWKALGSRIREKSVDFMICNKDSSPYAAIELQDSTHEQPDRAKSDEFKRKALKAAEIPLIEFHVQNLPNVEEIRKAVEGAS